MAFLSMFFMFSVCSFSQDPCPSAPFLTYPPNEMVIDSGEEIPIEFDLEDCDSLQGIVITLTHNLSNGAREGYSRQLEDLSIRNLSLEVLRRFDVKMGDTVFLSMRALYPPFNSYLSQNRILLLVGKLATGVEDDFIPDVVRIAPHPVSESASVTFSMFAPGQFHLSIMDVTGRSVYDRSDYAEHSGDYTFPILPMDIPGGTYVCVLKLENGQHFSQTFVKQ